MKNGWGSDFIGKLLFALSLTTIIHSIIRQQLALFTILWSSISQTYKRHTVHLPCVFAHMTNRRTVWSGHNVETATTGPGRDSKWQLQLQLHLPQQQHRKLTWMRFKMLLNYFQTLQLEFSSSDPHCSQLSTLHTMAPLECLQLPLSVWVWKKFSCRCNPFFFFVFEGRNPYV